jgi:V8-like Glu-specific endopeptidase
MRAVKLRPLIRRSAAAGISVILMSGALTGIATAGDAAAVSMESPSEAVAVPAPVSSDVAQEVMRTGKSRGEAVQAYWTEKRMREAIPVSVDPLAVPPQSPSAEEQAATPRKVEPAAPSSAQSPDGRKAGKGTNDIGVQVNASTAVGKVFYRNAVDGRDYVCSAGSVSSNSRRLVSTAGHCVHGGRGGNWHQNWVYVPYFNFGNRPYGTFPSNWLATFNGWRIDGNFDWDVAFVKVFNNEFNQQLIDRVGGHGLQTGQPSSRFLTMLGYPSENPYPGDWQYFCQGNTSAAGANQITIGCPLTRGQSGGPWLWAYNDSNGLGYINGTSSTLNRIVGPTQWWSPYFDNPDWDLYIYTDQLP